MGPMEIQFLAPKMREPKTTLKMSSHRPAEGQGGLQVPQQHAEGQEDGDAQQQADGLGEQGFWRIGRRDAKANAAQEKGDGLGLKGRALQGPVDTVGEPHGRH